MPDADHRVSLRRPAVALLATLLLAVSPAAAQPARSQLGIGARVSPSCEVSADGAEAGAATCTDGSDASISVQRRGAASAPDRPAPAPVAETGESASAPTWVTVTF